jgi:hypothetical protein
MDVITEGTKDAIIDHLLLTILSLNETIMSQNATGSVSVVDASTNTTLPSAKRRRKSGDALIIAMHQFIKNA